MACIIVCCLLMHCISGKSPKQIPAHILMSVGGQYPCIHVFWKGDGIWCWVDAVLYCVCICVCVCQQSRTGCWCQPWRWCWFSSLPWQLFTSPGDSTKSPHLIQCAGHRSATCGGKILGRLITYWPAFLKKIIVKQQNVLWKCITKYIVWQCQFSKLGKHYEGLINISVTMPGREYKHILLALKRQLIVHHLYVVLWVCAPGLMHIISLDLSMFFLFT